MTTSYVLSCYVQRRFPDLATALAAFDALAKEEPTAHLDLRTDSNPAPAAPALAPAPSAPLRLASPSSAAPPAASPSPAPAAVQEPASEPDGIAFEELQAGIAAVRSAHPGATARLKAMLVEYQVAKLSDIPAGQRAGFLATLKEEFPLG